MLCACAVSEEPVVEKPQKDEVSENSEIEERPGSYVSSVYSTETGEQEAFKILWAEDGFCFSAIVSEEIFENFKNGTELMKKEIYN